MIAEIAALFFHAYEPKPRDVVVEVGAGAGGETADLARMVGGDGYVLAVEPHPVSFRLLKERLLRIRPGVSVDWHILFGAANHLNSITASSQVNRQVPRQLRATPPLRIEELLQQPQPGTGRPTREPVHRMGVT